MIQPLPHIARMSHYALSRMTAPPSRPLVSLSQNESLRPPSPKAIAAATRALASGALYPDPDWTDLRRALGDLHGITADGILCGTGSLDLIGGIARAYSGSDRAVLAPAHAYPFFRTAAQIAGARFDTAPEDDGTVQVDALLDAVRADTAIVFIANPGNPTGTRIPTADLRRLRTGLPDDILLVIDEAYGEFADHLGEPSWDMVTAGNCAVLRSFSKGYGMAGFRAGWGLFPPQVVETLRKVMNPNNLTLATQAAAIAALEDQPYMLETCLLTSTFRDHAAEILANAGFNVTPCLTNFLLIRFDGAARAEAAEAALQADGIFLRRQQGAGLPHALRMTIGPEPATLAALSRLQRWIAEDTT